MKIIIARLKYESINKEQRSKQIYIWEIQNNRLKCHDFGQNINEMRLIQIQILIDFN